MRLLRAEGGLSGFHGHTRKTRMLHKTRLDRATRLRISAVFGHLRTTRVEHEVVVAQHANRPLRRARGLAAKARKAIIE